MSKQHLNSLTVCDQSYLLYSGECVLYQNTGGSAEGSDLRIIHHGHNYLYLGNFVWICFLKWSKPSLSLAMSLTPLGLWQSQTEFGVGRTNLEILVFRIKKLSDFPEVRSMPLHLKIADGKSKFFKKLCRNRTDIKDFRSFILHKNERVKFFCTNIKFGRTKLDFFLACPY